MSRSCCVTAAKLVTKCTIKGFELVCWCCVNWPFRHDMIENYRYYHPRFAPKIHFISKDLSFYEGKLSVDFHKTVPIFQAKDRVQVRASIACFIPPCSQLPEQPK